MKEEELRRKVIKYAEQADEKLLQLMETVASNYKIEEQDWWDDLDKEEQRSIERGLEDVRDNKLFPQEEVMKKFKKWH